MATALAAGLALSSCTVGDMFVESSADEAVAETGSENAPPARVVPQLNEVPDCRIVRRAYQHISAGLKRVYSEGTVKLAAWEVPFRESGWVAAHPSNNRLTADFHGMNWIFPLLQQNPTRASRLLVQQWRANPDIFLDAPTRADIDETELASRGWTESHTTSRLSVAVCAYQLSLNAKLLPVITDLVAANLDTKRFYGPPEQVSHNHGLMANRALRNAGIALGREDWVEVADDRTVSLAHGYWAACGMNAEQSTGYQPVNIRLWEQELKWLDGERREAVERDLDRARQALAALYRPDSYLETFGTQYGGQKLITVRPNKSLWCPWEGIYGGWGALQTARDGYRQHHIVKFGPAPRAHGQPDHGSATWWVETARGPVAVLSDPAIFSKDSEDPRNVWANSPAGASVFERVGAPIIAGTTGDRTNSTATMDYVLTTQVASGTQSRRLVFSKTAPVLAVADRYLPGYGAGSYEFVQRWLLSPGWVRDETHTARNGAHTLDIVCLRDGQQLSPTISDARVFPEKSKEIATLEVSCRTWSGSGFDMLAVLLVDAEGLEVDPAAHLVRTTTSEVSWDPIWHTIRVQDIS